MLSKIVALAKDGIIADSISSSLCTIRGRKRELQFQVPLVRSAQANLSQLQIRAGKREGSVVSTQSFDTITQKDRETWEALRRELEDIGISPGIITEKREFIIARFREAVAMGKLGEADPSDDSESTISSYESDDSAETSGLVDNKKKLSMGKSRLRRWSHVVAKETEPKGPCHKKHK